MITISIIEDHEQFRAALVDTLKQNSEFEIKGVYTSAEEALDLIALDPPNIAIVDIQLKNVSGIELIAKVKSKLPNTQFLICTAHQNNENVFNALKAGASGYIVKGATTNEIQQAVIELYEGGAPMSPYIARKVIGLIYQKDSGQNSGLSDREMEVLSLLSKGLLYKEISDRLTISTNTVKNHCKNIYKTLHVQNKVEAINKFRSL